MVNEKEAIWEAHSMRKLDLKKLFLSFRFASNGFCELIRSETERSVICWQHVLFDRRRGSTVS